MKLSNQKRMLTITFLLALAAQVLPPSANAGSRMRVQVSVVDSSTSVPDFHNCDPNTFLPLDSGACVGIQATTGTTSGSVEATYFDEANFAVLATGDAPFSSFKTLTGSVQGRGSGSFTLFEEGVVSPSGHLASKWRVVKGSGTANLVGISGSGEIVGTYDSSTALATGTLSGVLGFDK
jgi:hypothetical protein